MLARAGRDDDAVRAIRVLLGWDPRYARRAFQDSSLTRLRQRLSDVNIEELAARTDQPISRGQNWATIQERDLVPEGTAWDPATRSLLVGSLNKHKIVAIAADGTVTDRVPAGSNGLRSVVGIHVDSARGILWAASNPRYDTPADSTPSALFAFNAATGAFLRSITAPGGTRAFLNDLTTAPDGSVYVTDTQGARIFMLRPGANSLELFTAAGPQAGPNGITISRDGRHLFVSDLDHIQVVDLAANRTWRIAAPDSINVAAIDGLAFVGNSLVAHHPLSYWRVMRYELDPAFTRVVRADVFEWNSAAARTSTTGEVVGRDYYYIGNSQIDRMNLRTIDAATMEPIRMYRVRLP
jgi:sugar lactone lactonase YvrE